MLFNAAIVIVVGEKWLGSIVNKNVASLSPQAQRAYRTIEAGHSPTYVDYSKFIDEFSPLLGPMTKISDQVTYTLVGAAAIFTFGLGYLVLGRMGKGLVSVANAARQIANGDLSARAQPIRYASREEVQLTTDFNFMSASLQRAERELAESTASIAHELRTPLTILRGRLHGISDGVFALSADEIDGLLFQVEGLARLVDDLQTLSLANSHRLRLDRVDTDLAIEVRRVLAAIQPDLEASGLQPVLSLSNAPLQADGVRIRQVIGAVLANSCRYAAHSGVLRIATWVDQHKAILEIVDYGPGLPEGTDDRVFDRFWRGEASRSRNTGGSGLGLAVVRAIVEAHHGRATLTNHIGGGTLFEMRLPINGKAS